MSRRAMIALSAALTAFVLVLVGAAASLVVRSRPPSAGASAAVAQEATLVPIDVVRAREAEYRRLIEEANARLRAQAETVPVPDSAIRQTSRHERRHAREDHDDERSSARLAHERSGKEDDDG